MKVAHKHKTDAIRKARQLWTRGLEHHKKKEHELALDCFQRAVILQPEDVLYRLNAARSSLELNRDTLALEHANEVLKLEPDSELGAVLRVRALQRLNRHDEVLSTLEALPAERRVGRDYWSAHGCAMQSSGKHQEAIQDFMNALSFQMDDAMSHYRMGISFYELSLKEEAAECFRTGLLLGLGQNALHVHGMLAYAERESARWPQADEQLALMHQLVDSLPDNAGIMTTPFAHVTLTSDPIHQLKASRLMANVWRGVQPVRKRDRHDHPPRIRIGYLSGDLHQHATCVLMCEIFERHDRQAFEVFAYSTGVDDKSAMRRRVVAAIEHFVDVKGLPDQIIAERIAADDLDVLVDLKGYTAGNRMGVLARRPAPVQVSFLGFPGTTGANFIDYVVGDAVVTPIEHADHFSEKIAQMPMCYQPNDRQRPRPEPLSRAEVGLPEDQLVLCGFNQAYKISAEVLDTWAGLLNELPGSVLWLLDWHGQAKPNLLRELGQRGISETRVVWAPRWDLGKHISRVALADVFIDTWPCNAHTTASDALWAGLPVVTLMGETFASRVAASLLRACGLNELVTRDVQGYREMVLKLARDPELRNQLRQRVMDAREHSPLFDSEQFTKDFELLLQRMVMRQREGLAPDHLLAV
ncbi:MAG: hypothetical protein ACK4TS_05245 [Aquabacterium sp.]